MKDSLGDTARLNHIIDSISEIETYTHGFDFGDFRNNSMSKYASIKQLEIIGEASNHLTGKLKEEHFNVEWKKIIALRNILVHEYFGVDDAIVWDVINTDLPIFKLQIIDIVDYYK